MVPVPYQEIRCGVWIAHLAAFMTRSLVGVATYG